MDAPQLSSLVVPSGIINGGYYMYSKCHKMPSTCLKTPSKMKRFLSEKLIIFFIRNVRLPFSNANSEAGMWDITAIQVLSGV